MDLQRLHRVSSVNEAVALAETFQREGTHDWFRGQVSNWPLASTFGRLRANRRAAATERIVQFERWVRMTPGLESLAANIDSMAAVAQHYGLKTNFIDFTTEPRVAGFFASNGKPKKGMESCIICLNTSDLKDFWKIMPSHYPPPEFLSLDVPNLWRLEAQHGTFLFCPYGNFEYIYDLDRIVFPYTGPISSPTPEEMYPRKSSLEILLDQFFMTVILSEGARRLESMKVPFKVHHIEPTDYDTEAIKIGGIPAHDSWASSNLEPWLKQESEKLSATATSEKWTLRITHEVTPELLHQMIHRTVVEGFVATPNARKKLVRWMIETDFPVPRSQTESLSRALQWLWDGLRLMPYENEDVSKGIANCVTLWFSRLRVDSQSREPWLDAACASVGESIQVEFGANDGSYSRAYVSKQDLLGAVRQDIEFYFAEQFRRSLTGNMIGLLQVVPAADRLFNFHKLARLFAQQIAPSQVLVRFAGDAKRPTNPVFFSPARLRVIGLP